MTRRSVWNFSYNFIFIRDTHNLKKVCISPPYLNKRLDRSDNSTNLKEFNGDLFDSCGSNKNNSQGQNKLVPPSCILLEPISNLPIQPFSLHQRSWIYLVNRWFYFFINLPKTLNLQFLQLDLEFSSTQRESFFRYIPIWRRSIWMVVFTKQMSTKILQLLLKSLWDENIT